MPIENLVQVERAGHKVKIRLDFGDHFFKTPWILPQQGPKAVCNAIAGKVEGMVKQRQYQIENGMGRKPPGYHQAIRMLEYRLGDRRRWNCLHLRGILTGLHKDLKVIAPCTGRFAPAWNDLLIGMELFIQEEDIKTKIQQLVYGER